MNSYCEAIPYLQEFVDGSEVTPENQDQILSTMYNLTICSNNCKEYDRALKVFHRMHEIAPEDVRAMVGIGRYHNEMARNASDSVNHYRELEDEATTALWNDKRSQRFDSSRFYLGKAFELRPDDKSAALEYGVVCYVVGQFEDAARAFKKISELDPDDTDNWMSLGDCYLSIRQFTDAAVAYEKVIESDPDNKEILERLSALYLETGQKDKRKQVDQKLESL
jgi:tetratricopeptide (TPR) repeat protein